MSASIKRFGAVLEKSMARGARHVGQAGLERSACVRHALQNVCPQCVAMGIANHTDCLTLLAAITLIV